MFAETTVVGKGNNLRVQHGDDSGLWVEFYFNKVYQQPFAKIRVPGDTKCEWDRPVKDKDKARWPRQWEAFNQQRSQFGDQTLLENWEGLNDDQVRTLKGFNVQTVEQLAQLSDGVITRIGMGARDLVRRANSWIEAAHGAAKEEALHAELQSRDKQIDAQAQQLAAMQAQIEELKKLLQAPVEAKPKRAYTRKPKE